MFINQMLALWIKNLYSNLDFNTTRHSLFKEMDEL